MPFKAELNYFFLYIKKHVEEFHNLKCLRGDNDILTVPILDKIKKYIDEADVIIADCTGRNPNVFYELGIAHTLNKKVILITMDDIREAPSDIRHYEFIRYQLDKHEEFLSKLDNALRSAFVGDYEHLYDKALDFLAKFNDDTGSKFIPFKKEVFTSKVMIAEKITPIPSLEDEIKLKRFLLPHIFPINDLPTMEKLTKWLLS